MIHTLPRRTRLYRQFAKPAGYRAPVYRPTSKAIGPILNAELKDIRKKRVQA
jgi:hypothetical protein